MLRLGALAGALVAAVAAASGNGTVYIIRHGEKIWGLGCLNAMGQARAKNLVDVFSGKSSARHEAFGVPRTIFAHRYDDPVDCERCNQTVTPISEALKVPIDLTHGHRADVGGGNPGAAAAAKKALGAGGGPVLMAWEHINIQHLAADLGVPKKEIPEWKGTDYDTVYVLQIDAAQNLTSFRISAEHFSAAPALEPGCIKIGGSCDPHSTTTRCCSDQAGFPGQCVEMSAGEGYECISGLQAAPAAVAAPELVV